MKVPDTYSGSHAAYKEWRTDFRGYVASPEDNVPWIRILNDIEARGKKVISESASKNYLKSFGYDEDDTFVITTNLYNHLAKHTGGTIQNRVKQATHKAVMEVYRQIYQEGMKISKTAMFSMK